MKALISRFISFIQPLREFAIKLYKQLHIELGIKREFFHPESVVSFTIRFVTFCFIVSVTYIIIRLTLILTLFERQWFIEQFRSLYNSYFFESLFLISVGGYLLITLIRFFIAIRFSFKSNLLFLVLFVIYWIEKEYSNDFQFFTSKVIGADYFLFLIIPPLSEILLRIVYVFSSLNKFENTSIFIESSAILNIEEDKTTRKNLIEFLSEEINKAHFKSAYSIGIVGDWGVGKTSFIEILRKSLTRRDNVIMCFSPWLSAGKKSLMQGFIDLLKESLGTFDKSLNIELDNYLKLLSEIERNASTNFSQLANSILSGNLSAKSEFNAINQSIIRIKKRIVVFIDDLDRLDSGEVVEVLKLIRNTGNFSNTIYISCYDKIYLLHALQRFTKRNLNIILDKFFDIELPLSPIPQTEIFNYIHERFFKLNDKIKSTDVDVVRTFLLNRPLLTQFREVNGLITCLTLSYKLYGSALFFQDFFFFEILKVKYPFLVSMMWHRKETYFFQQSSPSLFVLASSKKDKSKTIIEDDLSEAEENEYQRFFLTPIDRKFIMELLKELFPAKQSHPLAIQATNSFDSYFYYNTPESHAVSFSLKEIVIGGRFEKNPYFTEPFDSKKQADLLTKLEESRYLRDEFLDTPDTLFKFLLFLVEWSDGRISIQIFNRAYSLFESIPNKQEHFEILLSNEISSISKLFARTAFVSTLIREKIYRQGDTEVPFIDLESLKKLNLILFNRLIQNSTVFSNQTFEALYHQIESIHPETRKITLGQEALIRFKDFAVSHSTDYLDMNIRSGMIPSYDLAFVFEPFTNKLFTNKPEFRKFIESCTDYPERRKNKLLEYLEKARENSNGVMEFNLNESELRSMPIEFVNAWRAVPQDQKEDIRFVESEITQVFKNQNPPMAYLDRNDHIHKEFFDLRLHSLMIEVDPKETEYWRLGFRFLESKTFPSLDESRHGKYTDVCVTVGEAEKSIGDGGLSWNSPSKIGIKEYNVTPTKSDFVRYESYQKDRLTLFLTKLGNGIFNLEIIRRSRDSIGSRTYDLSQFRYVVLSAWCDQRNFELHSKIKLVQPLVVSN